MTDVTILLPGYENTFEEMPHPSSFFAASFASTLYLHKLTANYMNIELTYDDKLLPLLEPVWEDE
jgi:hypothetical protein